MYLICISFHNGNSMYFYFDFICIYLRASPPAADPSSDQLIADWQTSGKINCWWPKLLFWRPGGSILSTWDIIFVILGSRVALYGHIEDQMSVFIDFRVHFGDPLGSRFL